MFITEGVLLTALVATPQFVAQGRLATTVSAGQVPVAPGEPTETALALQVTPSAGMGLRGKTYQLQLRYDLRLFYQQVTGVDVQQLDRPLFFHTVNLSHAQSLGRRWQLNAFANAQLGEVNFQNAAGVLGDGLDSNLPDPNEAPTGGRLNQTADAQALSTITFAGNITLDRVITPRLGWSNSIIGTVTRPFSDIKRTTNDDVEVGQLPDAMSAGYNTGFSYLLARRHTLIIGAGYVFNSFASDTQVNDINGAAVTVERTQLFHVAQATVAYAWRFAENSSFGATAGAAVAVATADDVPLSDNAADVELPELDTVVLPVPVATLDLSWLALSQRSITLTNRVSVGVSANIDPLFGTVQPRLQGSLGLQMNLPNDDVGIGLTGSVNTPLAEPDSATGFNVVGAGDSQLSVNLSVDVRTSEYLAINSGIRINYLFTRFGPPTTDGAQVNAVDDSFVGQVFLGVTFDVTTERQQN